MLKWIASLARDVPYDAEVGDQKSEIRDQRSEIRDQRSEGRGQRTEDRGQVSVFRCQEVKGKELILPI